MIETFKPFVQRRPKRENLYEEFLFVIMRLSIVSTLYNSAPHLLEFYERLTQCAQDITHDYEMILVNDGSPDASLELSLKLYEKDQRIRVIDLSRNFGHHKAKMTGLQHARGEYVFLIDSDLEEPPETLKRFTWTWCLGFRRNGRGACLSGYRALFFTRSSIGSVTSKFRKIF